MGANASVPEDTSRRLEVIGAGYSRTGTVSMQMALEILLKGPVCHGGTQIICREEAYVKHWINAYQTKRAGDKEGSLKAVAKATAGFAGTTDLPTIDFLPEMLELYPEAKVVLVKRDPETWWKSVMPLAKHTSPWFLGPMMAPVPGWRWFPTFIQYFSTSFMQFAPPGAQGGPDTLKHWMDYVRSVVPKDRLLEMELKEGWEPLCKFLGKPIPDEPFPRANDAQAVDKYAKDIFTRLSGIWLGIMSSTAATAYGAFWLWKHQMV